MRHERRSIQLPCCRRPRSKCRPGLLRGSNRLGSQYLHIFCQESACSWDKAKGWDYKVESGRLARSLVLPCACPSTLHTLMSKNDAHRSTAIWVHDRWYPEYKSLMTSVSFCTVLCGCHTRSVAVWRLTRHVSPHLNSHQPDTSSKMLQDICL